MKQAKITAKRISRSIMPGVDESVSHSGRCLVTVLLTTVVLGFQVDSASAVSTRSFAMYDRKQQHCEQEIPSTKAGCGYRCPTNACVKTGVSCVSSFEDCICKPGYHKPRADKYPFFNSYRQRGSRSGHGEAVRLREKMKELNQGTKGHCVLGHGRKSNMQGSENHPHYMARKSSWITTGKPLRV